MTTEMRCRLNNWNISIKYWATPTVILDENDDSIRTSFLSFIAVSMAGTNKSDGIPHQNTLLTQKYVVILGCYKSFEQAHIDALKISREVKMPFSLEGKIYDKKRGLILPDDFPDEIYAGTYFHRRYNIRALPGSNKEEEYISIEKSEAYPGFVSGFYIIVGGICENARTAMTTQERFKKAVKDAYFKKTEIYMGCVH